MDLVQAVLTLAATGAVIVVPPVLLARVYLRHRARAHKAWAGARSVALWEPHVSSYGASVTVAARQIARRSDTGDELVMAQLPVQHLTATDPAFDQNLTDALTKAQHVCAAMNGAHFPT